MEKITAYLKNNMILGIILIALSAFLVILIIAAIIRACVKSKKQSKERQINDKKSVQKSQPISNVTPNSSENDNTASAIHVIKEETKSEPIVKAVIEEKTNTRNKTIDEKLDVVKEQVVEENKEFETTAEPKIEAPVVKSSQTTKHTVRKTPVKAKTDESAKDTTTKNTNEKSPVEKTSQKPNKKTSTEKPVQNAEKRTVTEKATAKPEKVVDATVKNAYAGKWVISISGTNDDGNSTYCFELRASNGEKLLSSVDYKSLNGAKNGIKTYKTNIENNNFTVAQNKKGDFYFKLLNGVGHLLSTGETYPNKTNCENAIDSVKRFAATANIVVEENENKQ